jgi:hypothetical protein
MKIPVLSVEEIIAWLLLLVLVLMDILMIGFLVIVNVINKIN